jgi:AcrR family transcriptional regulator
VNTAALLARAFDTSAPAPEDAMGERILDAALHLVAAAGVRHLTMDDVAARAGVGRMTVYRRFGTRQQLLDALAVREARRCLAEIVASFRPQDPFDERAADVFIAVIRVIRQHPLLARLAQVEPEALLHELTRDDSDAFRLVRGFLEGQVIAAQGGGELPPGDPELLAELALRLGASFVLMPDGAFTRESEAVSRETMRALLGAAMRPGTGVRSR